MLRCPNCKEKIARFPIKDSNGKLIVKNLFKMDLMSIIWVVVIVTIVITYKADIKQCEEIITDPIGYCEESNACKIIGERESGVTNQYGLVDVGEIPEFDISG